MSISILPSCTMVSANGVPLKVTVFTLSCRPLMVTAGTTHCDSTS